MGRPRKSRLVEGPSAAAPDIGAVIASGSSNETLHNSGEFDISSMSFPIDPSLNFLDEPTTSNFDFLNLPSNSYHDIHLDPGIFIENDRKIDKTGFLFNFNGGIDLLGGINFDEPDPSAADMNAEISNPLRRYWQFHNEPLKLMVPPESLLSDLSPSPESRPVLPSLPAPTPKAVPSVACSCLSTLYLSLDSLSRLPSDIPYAVRTARNATKVAHDVIKCRLCSDPLTDDPFQPPSIQCFQSLMLLAALVPSICNAYAAILEMINRETDTAKSEQRQIWFSFKGLGGLWGTIADGRVDCPKMQNLNDMILEPDMWRNIMRGILRLDVYGTGDTFQDVSTSGYKQNGLRDVLKRLEERSSKRHDLMDDLVAQGKAPKHEHYVLGYETYKPVPPEERNCMRILEAARVALNHLVIA